jgi:DNA-directed RNA polymerase subunit RPC12/RpoP
MVGQSLQPKAIRIFLATGVAALGIVVWLVYLLISGRIAQGKPVCSICQRPLHPAQVFFVVSEKKGERRACCPRCGLRFVIESNGKPSKATDFSNGKLIDADAAIYLEGSDLMQCCASATMRADSGMICEMHYDRCLPSLVAFANLENARVYQQEYGGRLIDLAQARTSVARQMGR